MTLSHQLLNEKQISMNFALLEVKLLFNLNIRYLVIIIDTVVISIASYKQDNLKNLR